MIWGSSADSLFINLVGLLQTFAAKDIMAKKFRPRRFGQYIISDILESQGGMATIYLAYVAEHPMRKVIIKAQKKGGEYRDLVYAETNALRQLHHPGIVQIYPILGFDKPTYIARSNHAAPWYYIMEYIPNGNLEAHRTLIKNYPIEWKLELFYQLVTVVHYMHLVGYGHCDLKPSNIMFRQPLYIDSRPEPVLIDFGSISARDQVVEKIGTPRYTPPEMFLAMQKSADLSAHNGIRADKIDIWQLGVIFFELLTGEYMFQGTSLEVETTILKHELKRIQEYAKLDNLRLDYFLQAMLNPIPHKRPRARDILEILQESMPEYQPPRVAS